MENWEIKYWVSPTRKNDIELWFNTLTKEQAQSIVKELELLKQSGSMLRLPHSRSLGKIKSCLSYENGSMVFEYIACFMKKRR